MSSVFTVDSLSVDSRKPPEKHFVQISESTREEIGETDPEKDMWAEYVAM